MFVIFLRQLKERGSRKETSLASADRAVYFKQQGGRYKGEVSAIREGIPEFP